MNIRVNLSQKFQKKDESKVMELFSKDFNDIKKIWDFEGKIQLGVDDAKSAISETQQTWMGYRLTSKDSLNILQIRNNGFTLSRLNPYKDWSKIHK